MRGGTGVDGAGAGAAAVVFQRPLPYLYLARQLFPQAGVPFQTRDAFPLAAEPYAAALELVIEFVRAGFSRVAAVALLRSPHFRFEHAGCRLAAREIDALDRGLERARFGGGRQSLAALAASALHRENIDVPRFNELADLAGVRVTDRERILAITATPPRQERETSGRTSEASASKEK